MIRSHLASIVADAVQRLVQAGSLPVVGLPEPDIADPRDPSHGDFALNFALVAGKAAGRPPREIAEALAQELRSSEAFEAIEVAGPGFINLRLAPAYEDGFVASLLARGDRLAHSDAPQPKRFNVEYVSVNPNGPITVGSGRGAAFGDTLCNVLAASGNEVHREYYINDGVNSEQMRLFAESVRALAQGLPVPDNGYKGDYVAEVATAISGSGDTAWYQAESQKLMLARQKVDLASFGVEFDTWFSEQSLHDSGEVERCMDHLLGKGAADEQPYQTTVERKKGQAPDIRRESQAQDEDDTAGTGKTLWLRSTKFGDDKDRVLRRKDGRLTYIASDVAYHHSKFQRPPNCDKLITILGPDHHGYIGRLRAVVGALLEDAERAPRDAKPLSELDALLFRSPEERDACLAAVQEADRRLEVVIFQIVRFVKNGQPAPMRKRDGNIYSLRDLIAEIGRNAAPGETEDEQLRIGRDVARFFYLMRSHETHMDFDIDLATKQSDENPVFYAQYAHARIASILRKAADEGVPPAEPCVLDDPRELALVRKVADLPHEVRRCAEDYGVHRIATYCLELARTFHHFYDACRVIQPEKPERTAARLRLCELAALGLKQGLSLLGVSAPERMDRASA